MRWMYWMQWTEDEFLYNIIFDESGRNEISYDPKEAVLPRSPHCVRYGEEDIV
jgi:hypothetical protein